MQHHVAVLADLRRDIEHHTGKEGLQRDRGRRRHRRGPGCHRSRFDIGDEEILPPHLEHGFLIVQGGDARTRQHMHRPLRLEEGNQRRKVAGLHGQAEDRADGAGDGLEVETGTGIAAELAARHVLTGNAERGARLSEAERGVARVVEGGPIDPALELPVQLHLDDLRLDDHLTVDRHPRRPEERRDLIEFLRHRPHHHHARLLVDHHAAPALPGADQSLERGLEFAPEIALGRGLHRGCDLRGPLSGGASRNGSSGTGRTPTGDAGGGDGPRRDAGARTPLAAAEQVVHLEDPAAQAGGLDDDARALDVVVEIEDLLQRFERLRQGHVLQFGRDVAAHLRVHQHRVARVGCQRHEQLARWELDDRHAEALLGRHRRIDAQGRQQGSAHLFGQRRDLPFGRCGDQGVLRCLMRLLCMARRAAAAGKQHDRQHQKAGLLHRESPLGE